MHRIDGAGHVDHLFVAEDPATLRPPTEITPEIMNAFQEELATFIEWAGIALAKGDNTQLKQALVAKFAGLDVAATKAGVQAQTYTAFTTTGATGAFVLTPTPTIGAYAAGQRFRVKFHAAGNGTDTININTLGDKSLKQYDSSGTKIAAVIAPNQLADIEYDGVDMVILDPLPASSKGKNVVINGNFDIWQRNTTFALTTAGPNYTADRWLANIGTTGNNSTISRQAFTIGQGVVPNEPAYWLRYAVTAFVNGTPSIEQRIEGVRALAGKQVTLSFWAKADAARTVSGTLSQSFGSGGGPSAAVQTALGAFNLTNAWQKFTATVTLPGINGKTIGTNGDDYLQLVFTLPGAVCTVDFAQVQLEASASATAFEWLPTQQVLSLCQRYYETTFLTGSGVGGVGVTLDFGAFQTWVFKQSKRAVPTVSNIAIGASVAPNPYAFALPFYQGGNSRSVSGVTRENAVFANVNSGSGSGNANFAVYLSADSEL